MKYIDRWALMRNAREENLSEHSLEVAMIAHALCTIGNVLYGKHLNADRAAVIGMFHDASEIITGDMPTPVKYYNSDIRDAYKAVEHGAEERLLEKLPEDLRGEYAEILCGPDNAVSGTDAAEGSGGVEASAEPEKGEIRKTVPEDELYLRRLVKAADKISALIKCIEERSSGNQEFRSAEETTQKAVDAMAAELPEVTDFMEEFLPAYGKTLDELTGGSC